MAFSGPQRFLGFLRIIKDTVSSAVMVLQSSDDDQTNPALSIEDSTGTETAHIRSDGRLRVGAGSNALPNVTPLADPDTGLRLLSSLVIIVTNGTRRGTYNNNGLALGAGSAVTGAGLDLQRTDRALLLNRLTTVQRDALPATVDGMIIYNTTTNKVQARAAGVWVDLH